MNDFFDTRVRTRDIAETDAWLRAQYGRVDVRADDASYTERIVGDAAFTLRHLRWDTRADVTYDSDRFIVATSTPGYAWRIGDETGEYSVRPGIIQPGDHFEGHADHVDLRVVAFDPDHLTETARTIYGDDELEVRFAHSAPVSRALQEYWMSTFRWAQTQIPVLSEPLVRVHVHRSLAVATLEAFALNGDARERRASAAEQAAMYRSATVWIDDHASLPVTVDDAARAAGTSTRGLRRAFAANGLVASTPEAYLELTRLSAAHVDLVAGDPTCVTVGEIALRWGFPDATGFREAYLRSYGATPDTTLAR